MEIHFKNAHKDLSADVSTAVSEKAIRKLTTLKRYLGKHAEDAQVYVELGKISAAHQHGETWRAHIELHAHGKRYNAEARGEEPQHAIDGAIADIKKEVRESKKRDRSLLHKGGIALKALMRGFKAE